ncbi:MAG: hypothetical protein JWO36_3242 [Myxococcales bacterium]|nr:hypothetical protein [Myxococcales bacterium]
MDPGATNNSLADAPAAPRIAGLLASPTGVLVILPLLVISVGVVVLLLGRRATHDTSESLARRQLTSQAAEVQHELAFALDQAAPMLVQLRALADPAMPIAEVTSRLHDLCIGRPGVANASISFPSGVMRGTYIDVKTGELEVQESILGAQGTERTNYRIAGGVPQADTVEKTTYDPRTRPHYTLAAQAKTRVWLPPRTFFTSHKTGLTIAEPVFAADGSLRAVVTVDFDVSELSSFINRAPVEGARTVVFAADGTILAFPSVPLPPVASRENRLLRHEDFADPALEALFGAIADKPEGELRFIELATADGGYLASIAPVGGKRAGIAAPLDWYLATLVPERVLLGSTKRFEKQSLLASAGALAIALGVAVMFAWNLVRMRRAVGVARAQARSAEARARDLGSYRLVGKLGTGGMGEVWRAEHRLLARQAAVKLVRPEALLDPLHAPKVRERFRREAQTLASMRSSHTIELYDYGVTDDGTFFFVMELLDGVDLDRLVREIGALPAARVIRFLVQACQSLGEAHEAGLLHRDIKPANLFVCRAADEVDVIKVLDFGIVHSKDDTSSDPIDIVTLPTPHIDGPTPSGKLTQHGALVGTPGYIAPEGAIGGEIDARADLYALGCVAWWLLTASEVFSRTDEPGTLRSHAFDPVPCLRDRVTGWLPPALEALIVSCLAKRPQDRPANARALAKALRAIEIPAEHAWTDDLAQAWWSRHRPTSDAATSAEPTQVERVLVPQRESAPADIATAVQRPSIRVHD